MVAAYPCVQLWLTAAVVALSLVDQSSSAAIAECNETMTNGDLTSITVKTYFMTDVEQVISSY